MSCFQQNWNYGAYPVILFEIRNHMNSIMRLLVRATSRVSRIISIIWPAIQKILKQFSPAPAGWKGAAYGIIIIIILKLLITGALFLN